MLCFVPYCLFPNADADDVGHLVLAIMAFWVVTAFSPLMLVGERGVKLFYYWHSQIHVLAVLVIVLDSYSTMCRDALIPSLGFGLPAVLVFSLSLWGIRGVLNQPTKLDTTGH